MEPFAVEPFAGICFGMGREQAVARLREWARTIGEELTVQVREDGAGGGSVYLDGSDWMFAFSFDLHDEVCLHAAMWRRRPAGRDASVAWVATRVAAYGPPERVALLVPTESRPVQASLEWTTAEGLLAACLLVSGDGEWDIREDLRASPAPLEGLVALREHREALARLGGRLARRHEHSGWSAEFLARTEAWVRARAAVLERLAPLLPDVRVLDLAGRVAEATRMLDTIEADCPYATGRSWWPARRRSRRSASCATGCGRRRRRPACARCS